MKYDFEQISYHNWRNGKRQKAIGVIIKVPQKYAHLLNEIDVTFVDESFANQTFEVVSE